MWPFLQAEGEAQAATMLGEAISKNPGYLKLRKLKASTNIAKTVSCRIIIEVYCLVLVAVVLLHYPCYLFIWKILDFIIN